MVQKDELKMHLLILQNYTQICITMVMSYIAFPKNHGTHIPYERYVFHFHSMEFNPSTIPSVSIKMIKHTSKPMLTENDCLDQLQDKCNVVTYRCVYR